MNGTPPNCKDRICLSFETRIGFWRQEIAAMEQHLSDLQKADEATVLLAHKHDLNQVEIKGETTTLRELAAKLDVDHDVLQSLRNQPDEDGFEDWLDVLVLPWSLSVILASTGKK